MRVAGVVLMLLGGSVAYYFGWKGLSAQEAAAHLLALLKLPSGYASLRHSAAQRAPGSGSIPLGYRREEGGPAQGSGADSSSSPLGWLDVTGEAVP